MSIVTGVVLTEAPHGPAAAMEEINRWLSERGHQPLIRIGGEGGEKNWQSWVWGGAFNGLNHDEFIGAVENAYFHNSGPSVDYLGRMSLFLQGEDDPRFQEVPRTRSGGLFRYSLI